MVPESHHRTDAGCGPRLEETSAADRVWVDVRSADELHDTISRAAHPVVVAFEDEDCSHCRAQRTILSLAWQQLAWPVTTLRVGGHRLPHVADWYGVVGYPTLLVFSAGQVVDRIPGRRHARDVIDRLSRLSEPAGGKESRTVSRRSEVSSTNDSNEKG